VLFQVAPVALQAIAALTLNRCTFSRVRGQQSPHTNLQYGTYGIQQAGEWLGCWRSGSDPDWSAIRLTLCVHLP
jgi:hypothetical protein